MCCINYSPYQAGGFLLKGKVANFLRFGGKCSSLRAVCPLDLFLLIVCMP